MWTPENEKKLYPFFACHPHTCVSHWNQKQKNRKKKKSKIWKRKIKVEKKNVEKKNSKKIWFAVSIIIWEENYFFCRRFFFVDVVVVVVDDWMERILTTNQKKMYLSIYPYTHNHFIYVRVFFLSQTFFYHYIYKNYDWKILLKYPRINNIN